MKLWAFEYLQMDCNGSGHSVGLMTSLSLRTSAGGNGNHSVSLPIISIKIKVDQMLPSSYISSLLVSIFFYFAFDFLFP